MNIRFDVDFDGYPWPGPLAGASATFGHQWVGPQAFLGLLEMQLGLGGPVEPNGLRAAALVPALLTTPGFWSDSARVDPMGVADSLLNWRDVLWSGGWRGQPLTSRLKDLAKLTIAVLAGTSDRLAAVAPRLTQAATDIRQVELTEERQHYPHAWQAVLAALESAGTQIIETKPAFTKAKGDLLAAQNRGFQATADGSLQSLRPQGPQLAADAVAAWLAATGDTTSTVIIGADPLLDAALRRHGLPTVGATAGKCDSALLEILPLVIQMGWSPPDPARALELLTLPTSPIPRGIRGRLVGALKQWPAVDSDAWREALAEGLEKIEDTKDRKRIGARLDVLLKPTVTTARYPVAELKRRASVLINWLQGMGGLGDSDGAAYQPAIIQCSNFTRLLDLIGLADLNRPQLQRVLDDARNGVPAEPRFPAQAGLFSVVTPGSIGGPAERIIWWNFTRDSAPKPEILPLTTAERKALLDAGVRLPEPAQVALGINARWSRPLRNATSTLMLVCPRYGVDGEEQHPHPLWDQIAANADTAEISKLVVQTPIFSKKPKRTTHLPLAMPQPRREWRLPKGITVPPRDSESPSGAGALVGCSFQWTLRYAGEIIGGDTAELPSGDQLVGSIAHEILGRVLQSNPKSPEAAEKQAEQLFDVEGPRLAAILFMPGSETLKQRSRRATAQAAKVLVKHLRDAKLGVVAVEKKYDGQAFGIDFNGRLDLVVGPPNGVIDLKWSGEKYRKDELQAGAAYQLASYSHLIRAGGGFPPVAYFIISTQRMLTTHPEFFSDVQALEGAGPDEIWKAFERSYRERQKELQSGLVVAPGDVDDAGELTPSESTLEDGKLLLTPPCRFCSFSLLCGHGLEVDAGVGSADAKPTTREGT